MRPFLFSDCGKLKQPGDPEIWVIHKILIDRGVATEPSRVKGKEDRPRWIMLDKVYLLQVFFFFLGLQITAKEPKGKGPMGVVKS